MFFDGFGAETKEKFQPCSTLYIACLRARLWAHSVLFFLRLLSGRDLQIYKPEAQLLESVDENDDNNRIKIKW